MHTAKRLLFLVWGIVLSSASLVAFPAQAEFSHELTTFFQNKPLNNEIPILATFQYYAGDMVVNRVVDQTFIHSPRRKQLKTSTPTSPEHSFSETFFQELFIAVEAAQWSSEPLPTSVYPLHRHIRWELWFKLSTGQEISLISERFSPSSDQGFDPDGPWQLECGSLIFQAYSPDIGKAVMKILSEIRPDLKFPGRDY